MDTYYKNLSLVEPLMRWKTGQCAAAAAPEKRARSSGECLKGRGHRAAGARGWTQKRSAATAGSARSVGGLVVLDAGLFASFFEFAAEGFDGGDFVVEGDVGAAVGLVEGGAKEDIDVGALHEECAVEQLVRTST